LEKEKAVIDLLTAFLILKKNFWVFSFFQKEKIKEQETMCRT
jgi:hypothetical protein|tara:strand:- start:7581 stop:7706 length:126 start_codon:yes stop_codon:yes gene_type:complete